MTITMSPRVGAPVVLTLAAVTGLIPFAADMYLASLPEIGRALAAPDWLTQITLTGFLLLLGVGQLVAGPITDAVGRRRPLLLGLGMFVIGSLIAAVAPSMTVLIVARVLQGVGGAIGVVVANSSVRDHAQGDAATRLFAILVTVTGLAPVIAPALGGWIDAMWGWREVFVALAALGMGTFVGAFFALKESLPQSSRVPFELGTSLRGYARLLKQPRFVLPLAALGVMFMVLFGYIGGASYVYQGESYGVSSASFGTIFGLTGIALLVGATVANRLSTAIGSAAVVRAGVIVSLLGVGVAIIAVMTHLPLWGLVTGLAIALIGFGLCEPALMALCMNEAGDGAGSAAALVGAAQFLLGSTATIATAGVSALAWTVILGVLVLVALVLSSGIRR